MTRKPKPPEPRCPHCGCPELLTYARQLPEGFAVVTSCPGCGKVIPDEPVPVAPGMTDEPKRLTAISLADVIVEQTLEAVARLPRAGKMSVLTRLMRCIVSDVVSGAGPGAYETFVRILAQRVIDTPLRDRRKDQS